MSKKKPWYHKVYKQIKRLGIKTVDLSDRMGVTRTSFRAWFERGVLNEDRAYRVAAALDQHAEDVHQLARTLRDGAAAQMVSTPLSEIPPTE